MLLGLKDKTPHIFKITSGINSLNFWTQSPPLSSNTHSELQQKTNKSLPDMYLQEGEEGCYCIVSLKKSETQEREEKGKNPEPVWLPTSYECTACIVGMCLTRARSPDIADELFWHLPFCGYATSRKNPLGLFAKSQNLCLLPITGSQIPLFAVEICHCWPWRQKHAPANPVWLGTQILPFPVQPSSTSFFNSHKEGAKQFRAALVPAPKVSGFCLL